MKNKLKEELLKIELPLLVSDNKQLSLYKDGELVASYDPVYEIKIKKEEVVIIGWLEREYKHKLSEFNSITTIHEK